MLATMTKISQTPKTRVKTIVDKQLEGFAKRLRDTLGSMTQSDLMVVMKENGFEITQARLSHYMQGRNYPDPPVLAELAKGMGVSADYLLGLTDEPSPTSELLEKLATSKGEGALDKLLDKLSREQRQQVVTFAEYLVAQAAPAQPSPAEMRANILAMLESVERNLGSAARKEFERGLREIGFRLGNTQP